MPIYHSSVVEKLLTVAFYQSAPFRGGCATYVKRPKRARPNEDPNFKENKEGTLVVHQPTYTTAVQLYSCTTAVQRHTAVHVYWGANGLPTIGTHKLLRIPPLVPTSNLPHNVTSSTRTIRKVRS